MRKNVLLLGVAIAIAGFLFQLGLQQSMRSYAIDGLYFQGWSSEKMMQTVSIEDLQDAPFTTLFNLFIQPPAFDAIRAIFANIWATPDLSILSRKVDQSLLFLGAVLYGWLGTLVFWWLAPMTGVGYAIIAALFFMVHPACIYYATFLESTLLSTVLILWAYYLLWSLRKNPEKSIILFIVASLALFFTRSFFQWPAILVFALSLALLKVPFRRVVIFLVICGGVVGRRRLSPFFHVASALRPAQEIIDMHAPSSYTPPK